MLDTGLRAGELCALRAADVDMKTGKIRIRPGEAGKAKAGKGRVVYMGKSARRFVWRYFAEREDGEDPDAPLILGKFPRAFNARIAEVDIEQAHRKTGPTDDWRL